MNLQDPNNQFELENANVGGDFRESLSGLG